MRWCRRGSERGTRPRRAAWLPGGACAVAVLLLGLGSAQARGGFAGSPAELLGRMDADADGRVSLAEYQAYLLRGFRALDADGDGVVSRAELGVRSGGSRAPVDLTSRERALAESFIRQDADADGFLDASELAAPPQ